MSEEFEVREERVFRLYRNGQVIRNTHGNPCSFDSPDEALHVAANWEDFRAPTMSELRAMSTDELIQRAWNLRP